jgi:predicted ester cyclase
MSLEENKEIARKHLIDIWSEGRIELMPQIYDMESSPNEKDRLENMRGLNQWWHKACPDIQWTLINMIAEGDQVMLHWRVNGTYTVVPHPPPTFLMPPVGKPFSCEGVSILRIAGSKIVSNTEIAQFLDMLVETGVVQLPKPEPV